MLEDGRGLRPTAPLPGPRTVHEAEVLWTKLATGNYDWLDVRRNGRHVLGRPRLSTVLPDEPAVPPDDGRDAHRVEVLSPLQRTPRWEAYRARTRPGRRFTGWWTETR